MKIAVVGTGYVGLVTGTCFADLGNSVICVDNDKKKLAVLNNNDVPFYEPGLSERVERTTAAGRLMFTEDLFHAVAVSDIIFIAVGTPQSEDGSADLSAVYAVAESVFDAIRQLESASFKVLVNKSTVPVGTGKRVEQLRASAGLTSDDIAVVSNPEFLREGSSIYDFFHPDRVVLGSSSQRALKVLSELYDPLYRTETPIVKTNLESSELSKYASNAFLATKISFINEMANLCELTGADVKDVAKIMGMDGRIGRYFLHPGPGYGGSCFPKDTQALIYTAQQYDYDLKIVKAVEAVNVLQKERVLFYLKDVFGAVEGKTIALLGLAFKSNTDDTRDSSSVTILKALLTLGAKVRVFDPEVKSLDQCDSNDLYFASNSYDAVTGADAVMIATEWNAFRELDLERLFGLMAQPYFFDLRNLYSPKKLAETGFKAYVIGRQLISEEVVNPL